jgi:tRNA threonylcarbamoyladenosine biosynthesis protein TsaE
MSSPQPERIVSRSPEDTHRLAARLRTRLGPGSVLALHGELGSGKTCLVQGLARALGVAAPVGSPTFTLVNEYPGSLPLYHVDLYRIRTPQEALALGLDDYLYGTGITAIEWAERVQDLLPPHTVHVELQAGAAPDERIITVHGGGAA